MLNNKLSTKNTLDKISNLFASKKKDIKPEDNKNE